MTNDTDIIALRQPETVDDSLTEIARDGVRRMLAAALRAEADAFVAQHAEEVLPDCQSACNPGSESISVQLGVSNPAKGIIHL